MTRVPTKSKSFALYPRRKVHSMPFIKKLGNFKNAIKEMYGILSVHALVAAQG